MTAGAGGRHVNESEFGHRALCLASRHDPRIDGVLAQPPFFERTLCSIPSGNYGSIVAKDAECEPRLLEASTDYAREFRAENLELRSPRTRPTDMPVSRRKMSMKIRLAPDPDTLLRAFSSKHRTNIRRVYKHGMIVESGRESFNKKWNAESQPLSWDFDRPRSGSMPKPNVDNPRHRMTIAAWRRLPAGLTISIGPLLARGIP